MADFRYPIKLAARETGLSEYVLRIWEQRYGAVEPDRTDSKRRLYSPEQIERLRLLRELTHGGHSIGQIAKLPTPELGQLVLGASSQTKASVLPREGPQETGALLDDCLEAVRSLNGKALESVLLRGEMVLGGLGLLQKVVAPLVQTIGDLWRQGEMTAGQEHFATATLKVLLGNTARSFQLSDRAPNVVVGTPAGQVHEMGALLVSATAATLGWRVTYLGPSLPAAEIAGAARQKGTRAVALSMVYPEDDAQIAVELKRLRQLLPEEVALLVGGRAAAAYSGALEAVGAVLIKDLAQFGVTLDALRKPANARKKSSKHHG